MRCYLMRHGHIGAVELVSDASDAAAIKEATGLFETRSKEGFAGFEIWDRARLVHRHPQSLPKFG